MEFQFKSEDEKTAIIGPDEDVYPELKLFNQAQFNKPKKAPQKRSGSLYVSENLERPYDVQPARLPFTRDDLQVFLDEGFKGDHGYWSVLWFGMKGEHGSDDIYDDGFRSVVCFKTVDFMIRPLSESKSPKGDPNRLHISAADIKDCLDKALEQVNLNRDEPLKAITGKGLMINPKDNIHHPQMEMIPFEWKIDRVPEDKINRRVREWRIRKCGKRAYDYDARLREYWSFMEAQDPTAVKPAPGPSPSPGPWARRKRGSDEAGAGMGPEPSNKRRSIGAQLSTYSMWAASPSQSAMGSPQSSRPPSSAGSARGWMSPPSMIGSPSMMLSTPIFSAGMYSTGYAMPFPASLGSQSATGSETPSVASAYSPQPGLGPYPGQPQAPSLGSSPGSITPGSTGQESPFSRIAISQPGPGHGQQPRGYGDQDVHATQMMYGLGMPPRRTFVPGAGSGQLAPHVGFAHPQYGSTPPGLSQGGGNQLGMYTPAQPIMPPPGNAAPIPPPGMTQQGMTPRMPPSGMPPRMPPQRMAQQGVTPPMHPPGTAQQGWGMASQRMNPLEFGSSDLQSMPSNPQGGGNPPYPYQSPSQGGWNSQGGGPAPNRSPNYPGGASNQPGYQSPYYGRGRGSGHG